MHAWLSTTRVAASLFVCVAAVHAQEAMTIKGRVTDENNEPLATANVYIDGIGLAALTDTKGAYSLVIPASRIDQKQHLLVADLIGYRSRQANVMLLGENVTQDFQLPLDPIPLEPIVGVGEADEISVYSGKPWTKTGIRLNEGDEVTVTATGRVHPCWTMACGNPRHERWLGPYGSTDHPILSRNGIPHMALMGRIGEWSPFFIGPELSFEALVDGDLYLGVNDDDFRGNVGAFDVTIRRRPGPDAVENGT